MIYGRSAFEAKGKKKDSLFFKAIERASSALGLERGAVNRPNQGEALGIAHVSMDVKAHPALAIELGKGLLSNGLLELILQNLKLLLSVVVTVTAIVLALHSS